MFKYIVIVLAILAVLLKQRGWFTKQLLPVVIDGSINDQKFQPVLQAFRQNFLDGWEHEGAALAVYHNGNLVVDIWGGYADDTSQRQWKRDTMNVAFSSTKGMAALSIAKLVDDGLLKYSDLVTSFWPEFGQNGKKNVTVEMLVNHQAGLAALDDPITVAEANSVKSMSKKFEQQKPNWPPGTQTGYHAITYGWLLEQVVRRVDKKHRFLNAYFYDEILDKTGNEEFYIGLPKEHIWRVARLSYADIFDTIYHLWNDWQYAKVMMKATFSPSPLFAGALGNPSWLLGPNDRNGFNNPEVQMMSIPAASGIGTARGLAQPFNGLANGNLLSKETVKLLKLPTVYDTLDAVIGHRVTGGKGFLYTKSLSGHSLLIQGGWMFGNPGYGCQQVKVDLKNKISIGYLTNGMKAGLGSNCRTYKRLQQAVYDVIKKDKK